MAAVHTQAIDGGHRMLSAISVFSLVRVTLGRVRRNTRVKRNMPDPAENAD